MKEGQDVWLVHEAGPSKSRFRACIERIAPKTIRIRREGCGVSSIIFSRNADDSFPIFERASRGNQPAYRLELRA